MKKFRYDMPSAVMRIIVGLILMGFGVTVIVYFGIEDKRCSAEVTGTVIRIETQQIRSRTEYRPVFEYEYNGQVYTFNGYYDRSNYYNVGQTKTLKINPDDPTDAHLSQRSNWYAYPIFIAGLGMLAFGIHTIKKIKADKESAMY